MSSGSQQLPDPPAPGEPRHYLRAFDLFRVVAFIGVVGQHSVLWIVPGDSKIGWSLVMFLHATRNVFFFLATLLAVYSQMEHPLSVGRVWVRRLGTVLIPYLVWTFVYFGYIMLRTPAASAGPTLWRDLYSGYYQLYFLVVLFQVYILVPAIVWFVRRTRGRHGWVFGASLVLQLAMMTLSHYFKTATGTWYSIRHVDEILISSRLFFGYQLFIVAGALAADHLGQMQQVIERHCSRILWGFLGMFVVVEGYYAIELLQGSTPGHASDIYQPIATLWFLSACYGLWALGAWWSVRAARRSRPSRLDRIITWGSDASGGYYLSHVLVLQLIVWGLSNVGLTAKTVWGAGSAIIFVGTLIGAGILVTALWHTPVRAALTGPVRPRQRAEYPTYPPGDEPGGMASGRPPSDEPVRELAGT